MERMSKRAARQQRWDRILPCLSSMGGQAGQFAGTATERDEAA